MKRCNWLKPVVAGVAIACLAIPLTVLGATKAELMQKAQQHRALTTGKAAPQGKVATNDQSASKQRKALYAQKSALIKERRTLARQGNMEALNANSAQIDAIDAQLKNAKKGGAKI